MMSPKHSKKEKSKKWKWKKIFLIVISLGLLVAGAGVVFVLYLASTLPSIDLLENPVVEESTKIYDRKGETLLYEITGPEKRTVIPFEEIPLIARQATLAIEDAEFYNHPGYNWKSILRALLKDIQSGELAQGGSTITQQLAKNAFLSNEKTPIRKLKELILAMRLERLFTKDEILALYLNQIPYGSNIYGIESASLAYFGKSARDLTISEAATLASLLQAPSYYSPWGLHIRELLQRKDRVLEEMVRLGFISDEERRNAEAVELTFSKPSSVLKAPHFVIAVQEYLTNKYGEELVRTGGLKVTTTLDAKLQEIAEEAVREGAERNEELYEGKNAALVARDPKTGQILALVGSRDYFMEEIDGNFNVATQGLRQPGSAFKPIVYLEAFRQGYTPDTVLFDVKTEFDTTKDPAKSYQPENFDGAFRGPITLRNALAQSINVPAVKLLYLTGLDNVLKTAKDVGISTLADRNRFGLSLVLGGGEVKLIDLVSAYSVLAEEGIKHETAMVLKVETRDKVLEEFSDKKTQVIDAQPVRIINNILSDTEARSPLFVSSLNLTVFPGHEVALKTGTTNDYRDAWTIGYTPSLVVGVWAGNSDNVPMQRKGGSILAAVPIWSQFMKQALQTMPSESFQKPDTIISTKPALNGEYITRYRDASGIEYPQIHNILFYVNKRDPEGPAPANPSADSQFENWEVPVLDWARLHIPDFNRYNQFLPPGSTIVESHQGSSGGGSVLSPISINWISPENGSFVKNIFRVEAEIFSGTEIRTIELYLNNIILERRTDIANKNIRYETIVNSFFLQSQNSLKIIVTDEFDSRSEKEIIVFKE